MNLRTQLRCEHPNEALANAILDILTGTELLTVATSDDSGLHVCTAYFAFDSDCRIYFLSDPNSRHGQALNSNEAAAVSIHVTPTEWGENLQGIQALASASLAKGDSRDLAIRTYGTRFEPFGRQFSNFEALTTSGSPSRPYVLTFREAQITNEPRFGRRTIVRAAASPHSDWSNA